MIHTLNYVETYLSELAKGNLPARIDPRLLNKKNAAGRIFKLIQKLSDNMREQSAALELLAKGELPSVSPSRQSDPATRSIAQITLNSSRLAAESEAVHTAVLAGEFDVRAEAQQLPGFYGEVADALNDNIDVLILPLRQVRLALGGLIVNDFATCITGDYRGETKGLIDDMNTVCERLTALAASIEKIARGDTSDLEKYRQIVRRSEGDRMIPAMLLATQNIENLVTEVRNVSQNIAEGKLLSARVNPDDFEGGFKTALESLNSLLVSVSTPLTGTLELLSAIAVNDYTHDVDSNAKGDFAALAGKLSAVMERLRHLQTVATEVSQGDISELENFQKIGRRSENDRLVPAFTRMMESIQGLIEETGNIAAATSSGNFGYVCKTENFTGNYKKIIATFDSAFGVMAGYVKEVTNVMQAMSEGNLRVTVETAYHGQLDTLAQAVNLTANRLNTVIGEISGALTSISEGELSIPDVRESRGDFSAISTATNTILSSLNELLGSISQTAEQVAAGSSQVSAGSQSLSQGTTEQASSVEELTSSITEITDQVRASAENAINAKRISEEVSIEAKRGDGQMRQMLESMKEINEGSANISKIIKVIDDIAFQTNILALNAAVEAARAGQAGKGFAVVAEEVRNLAARSATAASDTTALIEGNIKKVEAGTKIADDTASELNRIVSGIEKSTALIGSIAEASNRQATSIAQIDTGIEQVSVVVQTNSSTSEESAAASEELSGQAETLMQLVGRFHLR